MIRYGIVSAIDVQKGRVKVKFPDSGIVSGWLSVSYPKTTGDKFFWIPDVNSQVVCAMDNNSENGIVTGCIYGGDNIPPQFNEDMVGIEFKDGTKVIYNRSMKEMDISGPTKITIQATNIELDGDLKVTGKIDANGEVKALAAGPGVKLSTHVHVETGATTNAPTPGT